MDPFGTSVAGSAILPPRLQQKWVKDGPFIGDPAIDSKVEWRDVPTVGSDGKLIKEDELD